MVFDRNAELFDEERLCLIYEAGIRCQKSGIIVGSGSVPSAVADGSSMEAKIVRRYRTLIIRPIRYRGRY